ncbi:MAG: formate dehydrogenase subunit gamma [Gammaproteobacteria bacterium]
MTATSPPPGTPPFDATTAAALVAPLLGAPAPLIEAMHVLQDHFGYVHPEAVALLADRLNLSRAEVHGVLTFYDYFRTSPPGRHVLRLCRAEACQARGAEALVAQAARSLGCALHETSADGAITLEAVYCLGNCACAPSALLDTTLHGRLDADGLDALIGAARAEVAA